MSLKKKVGVTVLVLVLLLVIGVSLAYLNISSLAQSLSQRGVPGLSFGKLEVGWNGVELRDIEYQSPESERGAIKASSILIRPSVRSLFTDVLRITTVQIDEPFLHIERDEKGHLELPFGTSSGDESSEGIDFTGRSLLVERSGVSAGKGEFVDRSVGRPYARYEVRDVHLSIEDLRLPPARSVLQLFLKVPGRSEGSLELDGWVNPTESSCNLRIQVGNLDIKHLEPYLRGVQYVRSLPAGTLGADLDLSMDRGQYKLAGGLKLTHVSGGPTGGDSPKSFSTVLSDFLRQHGEVTIPVDIEGDLNQPGQQRHIAATLASALVGKLGLGALDQLMRLLKGKDDPGSETTLEDTLRNLKELWK